MNREANIAAIEKELLRRAFGKASARELAAVGRARDAQKADAARRGQAQSGTMQVFDELLSELITTHKMQKSGVYQILKSREDHLRGAK
jgi:hypothetical protein